MRRTRPMRAAISILAVTLIVFSAFVPGLAAAFVHPGLTPLWLVVPAVAVTIVRRTARRCDEQPVALVSLVLFRAPPASLALA